MMPHVVLLGDSVFDNRAYVAPEPDVVHQLQARLGPGWDASLLAVDGDVTADVVARQMPRLPADATHLIVSAGGNDALRRSEVLGEPACSVADALGKLSAARAEFERSYRSMIEALASTRLPAAVCTIYDTNYPEPQKQLVSTALALFNDVITRLAFGHRMALIDLRLVCCEPKDFANPIEPSAVGGAKIAGTICAFLSATPPLGLGSIVWTG